MMGDPRDAWTYRLAVGALGLAVAIALAGAIVIAALGEPTTASPSSTIAETTTTKSRIPGGSKVTTVSESTTGTTAPATNGTTAQETEDPPVQATNGTTASEIEDPPTQETEDPPAPATSSVTPTGLYVVGGALTGALLGILIPSPLPTRLPADAGGGAPPGTNRNGVTWALIGLAAALLAVFATTIALGVVERIVSLEVLGAASGAALLGMFVPSPAMRR